MECLLNIILSNFSFVSCKIHLIKTKKKKGAKVSERYVCLPNRFAVPFQTALGTWPMLEYHFP